MNLYTSLKTIQAQVNLVLNEARLNNEPFSRKEGQVELILGPFITIRVFSNFLFGGYEEWSGKNLDKLINKVLTEVANRVKSELSFPRELLKDVE